MVIARQHRVGGTDVAPGRSLAVQLGTPEQGDKEAGSVPAWIVVGARPGPRISVLAAVRGYELGASRAVRALADDLDPTQLKGSVLLVPVFRPGGRFARPGRVAAPVRLPGDAGGGRAARLAFALYSEVVVPAQYIIEVGCPWPGRQAPLIACVDLADPRARGLALGSGAVAVCPAGIPQGHLGAAAQVAGRVAIRLCAGGGEGQAAEDAATLLLGVRRVLATLDVFPLPGSQGKVRSGFVVQTITRVRAPRGGFVEGEAGAGTLARRRDPLASIAPAFGKHATVIQAPVDGLVLEAPARGSARRGAVLFVLGSGPGLLAAGAPRARARRPNRGYKVRTGWIERVSLPDLNLDDVHAKIDTGARTSALHVTSIRTLVPLSHRRPVIEITVPAGVGGRRRVVVRVHVRGTVDVRDSSGRMQSRPVIETMLQIGPLCRRIRLTLTNRGDMRCPMLVGRSAVGGEVVVDPSGRFLLDGPPAGRKKNRSRES